MIAPIKRGSRPSVALAFLLGISGLAVAADHRDGPRITDLNTTPAGALDLNDLYIFQGANRNNTVLIQTMSPGAGIVGPGVFFAGAAYELRISNDGDPLTDEIVFRTVFSPANARGQQRYQIRRADGRGEVLVASGLTNTARPAIIRGGGQATAGLFDDPFFFDVNATARTNRELTLTALGLPLTGVPAGASPVRHLLPPSFPNNFFGGFNTLAIVIEVPRFRIQSGRNNPNITAWIRSVADTGDGRGFAQFDRTAVPSINTVVVPLSRTSSGEVLASGLQDQFNFLSPGDDIGLRPIAVNRLNTVFGLSLDASNQIANTFLPDVARFNTTSRLGFPNGRRLRDDVIDVELQILTNNALSGDRVGNDSFFRRNFPYIGTPNPVTRILAAQIQAQVDGADSGE